MELSEVVRRRRMCRSFTDRAVDPATVDTLLGQARRAPSAGHTQGWAWLVLDDPDSTRRFWELDADPAWLAAPSQPGLLAAPVILVPWSNPGAYAERYREADKAAHGRPGGRAAGAAPAHVVHPGAPAAHPPAPAAHPEVPGAVAPEAWPVPWWDVDLAFSVMILLLGATDLGLGALFFALHGDPGALAAGFGVPDGWRALGAVALGWPDPDDRPSASAVRGRRPAAEVVHRGSW